MYTLQRCAYSTKAFASKSHNHKSSHIFQVLTLRMLLVRKLLKVSVSAMVSRRSRQVESTEGVNRPGFDDDDDDDDDDDSASSPALLSPWGGASAADESPDDDDDERPCAWLLSTRSRYENLTERRASGHTCNATPSNFTQRRVVCCTLGS